MFNIQKFYMIPTLRLFF